MDADIAPVSSQRRQQYRALQGKLRHDDGRIQLSEALNVDFNRTSQTPTLSVCVSLKNRSRIPHDGGSLENFPRCVRSLVAAVERLPDRDSVELVVVDFESDDWPLAEWLVDAVGSLPTTVVRVEGAFSKGAGLNQAAATARSDWLFLCDADMLVVEPLLARGMEVLRQGEAFFPLLRHTDLHGNLQRFDLHSYGNAFVTRSVFNKAGGVPEFQSWGGEDDIFHTRVHKHVNVRREHVEGFVHQWHPERNRHKHYVRPKRSDHTTYLRYGSHELDAQSAATEPGWRANCELPRLACVCATYLRPRLLANVIACFEQFEYPADRHQLIVLDDAGQYPDQPTGPNWRIVSVKKRFSTLGDKRNALAEMAPADTDAFVVIDDDDVYLPWTLTAHAWALGRSELSCPDRILTEECAGEIIMEPVGGAFHPSWAYSRELFLKAGKYPKKNYGEDHLLRDRMKMRGARSVSATGDWPPWFISRWTGTGSWHLSGMGEKGYSQIPQEAGFTQPVTDLRPAAVKDWMVAAGEFFDLSAEQSRQPAEFVRKWRTSRTALEVKMVRDRHRFIAVRQIRGKKSWMQPHPQPKPD